MRSKMATFPGAVAPATGLPALSWRRLRRSWRKRVAVGLVLAACLLGQSPVAASEGDVGYEGASFSGTGTPTGTKRAESILWHNDGSWWAHMWDTATKDFHIFRLDSSTQRWIDTGVTTDPRGNTHADVLWDGSSLYIASHTFVNDGVAAVAGFPSYLYRYSYDAQTKSYSPDPGFPVLINNYKTETLVIDKDSTGKLWATWMQDNQIYVNRTNGDDRQWGEPFPLPAARSSVTLDDTSAVVAFGGNKIGVMWSNQSDQHDGMYFAEHRDGDPDTTWQTTRTAIQGPRSADDHMNLKTLQSDQAGHVYAAIKTEFNTQSAPLILLLVRDPVTAEWTSHRISRVSECPNRPIVLIDEENSVLHAFYTSPGPPTYSCNSSGGAIHTKTSPLDDIAFPDGAGTPVIVDADSPYVHNVTSTKQNVNSSTGMVVLAANGKTARYWHAYSALAPKPVGTASPVADFSATPTSGTAPLAVAFTDTSTGDPTAWTWTFGDGTTSTSRNPSHTYTDAGTYTVKLTATNTSGSSTVTKTDHITVTAPPPDFALSASPSFRSVKRGQSTTYTVTVTALHNFAGPVTLAVSGVTSDMGAAFSPAVLNLPGDTVSTLTITTTSATKPGNRSVAITGSSGSLSRSAEVTLQVKK